MRYLFIFLAVIISYLAQAQTQTLADYEEVIYLKNGSIIHGIIIELIPGKSVKIQTSERNVFVYQMDEIEKITKEIPAEKAGGSHSDGRKAKGFELYIDEGVAVWVSGDPYPMNQLTVTPGYKFNRMIFLGGSTGLIARKGFASVPVAVDLRFTFTKTKVAPLLQLNAGYMSPNLLSLGDDSYYDISSYGGFLFGVKPGLGINLKKNIDLNFYTGYQLGSQITEVDSYYSDDTSFGLMHFFVFTAGVKF